MKLLGDTSALLALVLKDDRRHREAVAFLKKNPGMRLVLTDLVLAELATRLRARTSAEVAARVVRDYLASARCSVVFVDADIFTAGISKLERFADQRLSLTDCVSFELMERLDLAAAFSFDADFVRCGYRRAN